MPDEATTGAVGADETLEGVRFGVLPPRGLRMVL